MTDIVERLAVCSDIPICSDAKDEIERLRAALLSIDEQFTEAAQDDCENGIRWLNERSAKNYLNQYPHTRAAISFCQKVIRALLKDGTV